MKLARVGAAAALCLVLTACATPSPSGVPTSPPSAKTPAPTASPPPWVTSDPSSPRYAVPPSIDPTGTTDASAALTAFVDQVPDGSTIVFPAAAVYRMDRGLLLSDRSDLVFDGNGATFRSQGDAACSRDCSLFYLNADNERITIRGFTLVGNSPTPGEYHSGWEQAHGISIVAGRDIEIADVTIRDVGGDGLYLTGIDPAWPEGVWFHDSRVLSCGRMGVAVVAGRDVTVERVAFGKVGYGAFDIEPNDTRQGATNVTFRDNTVGSWGEFFAAANGAPGSTVRQVTVSGNVVERSSLLTIVITPRREDFIFTANESRRAVAGPVLRFAHVDGLTIADNIQPLTIGPLMEIRDCTDVTR
jgi:Right handed beta helix region